MNQEIPPLVMSAVGWMYGHRDLLYKGYGGEDPEFSEAKSVFLEDMKKRLPEETEESLLRLFEAALNVV